MLPVPPKSKTNDIVIKKHNWCKSSSRKQKKALLILITDVALFHNIATNICTLFFIHDFMVRLIPILFKFIFNLS